MIKSFTRILTCKAANAGKSVIKVNARGTSQECSECGTAVPKELGELTHSCSCGYVADRDLNAARNILKRVPEAIGELTPAESTLAGNPLVGFRRDSLKRKGRRPTSYRHGRNMDDRLAVTEHGIRQFAVVT